MNTEICRLRHNVTEHVIKDLITRRTYDAGEELANLGPRAGSGVVRIDAFRFLDGRRTRRLSQAMSVLSLGLDYLSVSVVLLTGAFLHCVIMPPHQVHGVTKRCFCLTSVCRIHLA